MKWLLVTLLLFSFNAYSADQQQCDKLKADGATQEQLARSGCCSWHGGVCGCSGERVTCCDGSLSPSCGCHADDNKDFRPPESETPKS